MIVAVATTFEVAAGVVLGWLAIMVLIVVIAGLIWLVDQLQHWR